MIQIPEIHLPVDATLQNGKYQIISVLGQGGFGITYLAKHKVFGEVALKELFLSSESAKCSRENTTQKQVIPRFKPDQFQTFKDRFLEEAKTLYNLRGVKGVVNVHDIFEENGTVYFSMEYLKGTKLDDYVNARKRLSESEGLEILKSLGQSLAAIHEKNVLHRDIKPANIIIGDDGAVHLIDFGIAKSYLEEVDETHTTFHSPRFSPPEQKIARSRMGTFSDIYSLGATGYFLLTGSLPQSLEARLLEYEEYRPPNYHVPSLSDATNDTIVKSLMLKDKERIQTAQEFLDGLSETMPVGTNQEKISVVSNTTALDLETDKTKIDFDAVKNQSLDQEKTEIFVERDKTEILPEPSKESLKKVITNPPGEMVDERTVIASIYQKEEVDHDKTIIDHPMPAAEKTDWKAWLKRNKKLIPIGVLALLIPVVCNLLPRNSTPQPLPPEPIEKKYLLNFQVKDVENKKVLEASTVIGRNSDYLKINSLDSFQLDLSEAWKVFESQEITVSHPKYLDLIISVKDLINKDTTIFLEAAKDNLLPNPAQLCENLTNNWISEDGKKLALSACLTENETKNPEGNAEFDGQGAIWSSYKDGDKVYLKLFLIEDVGKDFNFQVIDPDDPKKTRLSLIEENRSIIFKINKKPRERKKPYNIRGQVFNQDGFNVPEARVYISNSEFEMTAMNQGRFYFDLSNDWNSVKNQQLIIEHEDFERKTYKLKEIVNRDNYIVRIQKKVKNVEQLGETTTFQEKTPSLPTTSCKTITNYWLDDNTGIVLEIKKCNGNPALNGSININGTKGTWSTRYHGQDLMLSFPISGRSPGIIKVEKPEKPNQTTLLYAGKRYKKATIEEIFMVNILGTFEDNQNNKLVIKNTNGKNGKAIYNGKEGTYKRSSLNGNGDNASITFRSGGNSYVFDLRNITERNNTYLKLLTKNGIELKSEKKTKHKRVY